MFKGTLTQSELTESDDRQRKLGSFGSSQKRAHIVFLQHSTLTRHINFADHKLAILATYVSKKTLIYARKKITPQSMMMLLNRVDCMVSENLPLPKFKSLIVLLHELGLENIHIFQVFSVCLPLL